MAITVTPQPDATPAPRVRIDIETGDPSKTFTSLTVLRDGQPIREQPYIGGTSAVTFDYEAPFGVDVAYTAQGSVATYSTLHNETWSSLSGWTTSSGSPTVTGSHLSGGGVTRPLTFPARGRIISQGITKTSGSVSISFGLIYILSGVSGEQINYGGPLTWVSGLDGPFTLIWDEENATITTADGTWIRSRGPNATTNALDVFASSAGFVEDFVISTPVELPFTYTAETWLDINEAWLIHPTFPSLSVSIDPGQHRFRDSGVNVDRTTKSSKTRAARSTRHEPYGRKRAVVITSGSRAAAEWTLVLRTMTLEDRDSVEAVTEDQTPLLLRTPVGWTWDLPDDWYSVGDYSEDRPRPRLDSPERLISLPLTPVDPPIVRQAPVWTYGTDLLLNPTYGDSLAEFPTYFDRLVGPT